MSHISYVIITIFLSFYYLINIILILFLLFYYYRPRSSGEPSRRSMAPQHGAALLHELERVLGEDLEQLAEEVLLVERGHKVVVHLVLALLDELEHHGLGVGFENVLGRFWGGSGVARGETGKTKECTILGVAGPELAPRPAQPSWNPGTARGAAAPGGKFI